MQPSLARCMMHDCDSELDVAGGDVLRECKVFRLRTEVPFVVSDLTITARYVYLPTLYGIIFS